jgi:adenylate kinase
MYLVLLGAPGAGKGTQAATLSRDLKVPQVASGDLFRKALNEKTELGLAAQVYMEQGQLVPDEITVKMVLGRLEEPDCAGGALLDGFPRNLEQAKALDAALAERQKAIGKVIYLKVPEGELLKRLSSRWICRACQAPVFAGDSSHGAPAKCDKCGGELYQREDDQPETVQKRLAVYFAETAPLIDYYRQQGKLAEIDGVGAVDEIAKRIKAAL